MKKREIRFIKMTTTITTYGVGKSFEEAVRMANEQAYDFVESSQNILEDASVEYEQVKQEDTYFDDVAIEMLLDLEEPATGDHNSFDDIKLGLDDGE